MLVILFTCSFAHLLLFSLSNPWSVVSAFTFCFFNFSSLAFISTTNTFSFPRTPHGCGRRYSVSFFAINSYGRATVFGLQPKPRTETISTESLLSCIVSISSPALPPASHNVSSPYSVPVRFVWRWSRTP